MSHEYQRAYMNQLEQRMPDIRQAIYTAISRERARQEELKAAGKFGDTPASHTMIDDRKLTILTEEVGEVARAILDGKHSEVRTELIQVAAVAVSWLESIDSQDSEPDLIDTLAGLLGGK